ncbi:MAG TPA: ArsA-related P-loop ATPase [Polyangia bacterium]|jgi:anion-transporting  ArsA/GET3 family ATPase|nr:ArsA-related P-loop ATPase [Polyangia bacterium]
MIRALVEQKRILVCVGPGGVGKTTTAAALGATAARLGRKTLVCTIDPAPRLADALGVSGLGPEPRLVPAEACRMLGIPEEGAGRLYAVRLDTARAFARLVDEQVADPEMRRRIFDNAIYRQITTSLTGSQEYAATLALYELARGGDYDLIVLDTPPTANALDFLDAPQRIAAAVSSPALSWFARPSEASGLRRLSFRRLRAGGAIVLRRLAKLVGSRFLDDVGAFLTDFQQVLGGFLEHAKAVDLLLRGPDTAFLLVLVPAVAAVDEALYFHGKLRDAGVPLAAFIANRVQPAPGITDAGELAMRLRAARALADLPDAVLAAAADRLAPLASRFAALHAAERREIARLAAQAPGTAITQIPLLDHDADNLAELRVVGEALLAG